jgi:hypothetical protein
VQDIKKRIVFAIATGLIGLVGAAAALGFLFLGLFFWLSEVLTQTAAALVTALIILVAATAAIGIVRLFARQPAAPPQQPMGNLGDIAAQVGNIFGSEARGFASRHAGAGIIGSLALGFIVGMSPGLRDLFRRF